MAASLLGICLNEGEISAEVKLCAPLIDVFGVVRDGAVLTGALVNHRSETNGGKVKRLSPSEWYRHESFFPVIVPREQWEAVQRRMKEQARPANGNKAKHRYAGLLTCQECGNPFVPMIRYWRGNQRGGICVPGLSPEREKLL